MHFHLRLKDQLADALKALKGLYKELQNKQAEALNKHPDKPVSQLACCNLLFPNVTIAREYHYSEPRPFNDALLKLYANVTKQDLVMNNLVVRAKKLSCILHMKYRSYSALHSTCGPVLLNPRSIKGTRSVAGSTAGKGPKTKGPKKTSPKKGKVAKPRKSGKKGGA